MSDTRKTNDALVALEEELGKLKKGADVIRKYEKDAQKSQKASQEVISVGKELIDRNTIISQSLSEVAQKFDTLTERIERVHSDDVVGDMQKSLLDIREQVTQLQTSFMDVTKEALLDFAAEQKNILNHIDDQGNHLESVMEEQNAQNVSEFGGIKNTIQKLQKRIRTLEQYVIFCLTLWFLFVIFILVYEFTRTR